MATDKNKVEKRFSKVEIRAKDDGSDSRTIRGYAAVFGKETDMGYFIEEIDKGFFDDVLKDDVRALFNHDPNMPLARTGAGLKIGVDATGLWYEFEAPNTSLGNDLLENIRTGVIKESSFSFAVKEEKWKDLGKGKPSKRTLLKAEQLFDISPVTFPAYNDTTVAVRSKQALDESFKKDLAEMDLDQMRRDKAARK
jgi:uncharacterized protein